MGRSQLNKNCNNAIVMSCGGGFLTRLIGTPHVASRGLGMSQLLGDDQDFNTESKQSQEISFTWKPNLRKSRGGGRFSSFENDNRDELFIYILFFAYFLPPAFPTSDKELG